MAPPPLQHVRTFAAWEQWCGFSGSNKCSTVAYLPQLIVVPPLSCTSFDCGLGDCSFLLPVVVSPC